MSSESLPFIDINDPDSVAAEPSINFFRDYVDDFTVESNIDTMSSSVVSSTIFRGNVSHVNYLSQSDPESRDSTVNSRIAIFDPVQSKPSESSILIQHLPIPISHAVHDEPIGSSHRVSISWSIWNLTNDVLAASVCTLPFIVKSAGM